MDKLSGIMKRKNSKIAFKLNGEKIYTSWIFKIKREYNPSRWLFNRMFFRAWSYQQWVKHEKKVTVSIIAIIEAGLKGKWIGNSSPLEDTDKPYVESWIGENVPPYEKKERKQFKEFEVAFDRMKPPESISNILNGMNINA